MEKLNSQHFKFSTLTSISTEAIKGGVLLTASDGLYSVAFPLTNEEINMLSIYATKKEPFDYTTKYKLIRVYENDYLRDQVYMPLRFKCDTDLQLNTTVRIPILNGCNNKVILEEYMSLPILLDMNYPNEVANFINSLKA